MIFPDTNIIRIKRKALNLTQPQLAKECGISQSLIAKIESGKTEASYNKIKRIFETLDRLSLKHEKKAEDIMSKKVVFVRADETVRSASTKMKENSISQLPVFSGNKVIGSISESGIIDRMTDSKDIFKKHVKDILEECFPTVNKNMPIRALISMLKESRAILVSDNSRIIGIISKSDVI